jgi:hypothetical protein
MRPSISFLVAAVLALSPLAGFAHEPEQARDFGSGASSVSSSGYGHETVQAQQQDDDDPDILLMALLTVGIAAGAAALSLIGYVIRQRIGFWLHRPPPRDGSAPQDHH